MVGAQPKRAEGAEPVTRVQMGCEYNRRTWGEKASVRKLYFMVSEVEYIRSWGIMGGKV